MDISSCPIAYRKIKRPDGRGKCNIDFAKDAFDTIDFLGNCVAICLDIKGYFESLDHLQIKQIWCDLLGVTKLPADHYAVFKNITQYHYVDQKNVYTRLGYWGVLDPSKPLVEGPLKSIPIQICTPKEFREKICGLDGKSGPSLIEKNSYNYGIPQGAPISDIIANFYLLYFDKKINDYVRSQGGKYLRYSDDILIILPKNSLNLKYTIDFVSDELAKNGKNVSIKKEKTSIVEFFLNNGLRSNKTIAYDGFINNKDGLEYLGFRYDGNNVYVREGTVSRFYRKISIGAKKYSREYVKDNPKKDIPTLINDFNFSIFYQKYGKVNKKYYIENDYKSWTFYSYIKRSCDIFEEKGKIIRKQFSNFQKFVKKKVSNAIVKSWNKKNNFP
ncbi:reverse transcriptase domain-containing protein [Novacetimonas cocois]|nr:reverse transcriptase domain-containing protein [Novacetimonas cocois]